MYMLSFLLAFVAFVQASQYDEHLATVPPISHDKFATSQQGSSADRTRLLRNIFRTDEYDKRVNPDNVTLSFGVEQRDVLNLYGWLRYEWVDDRLKWDPKEYGDAEVIRIDSSEVWKPDVTLYNSADPAKMVNCWESNVLISSSGKVLWVPPCKMSAQCHFDLRVHPYGEQSCELKFGSWTFDGHVLGLQLYKEKAEVDLSGLNNSSGFQVVSTSAQRIDKYYECCVEPYPNLTFNITIKRTPGECRGEY